MSDTKLALVVAPETRNYERSLVLRATTEAAGLASGIESDYIIHSIIASPEVLESLAKRCEVNVVVFVSDGTSENALSFKKKFPNIPVFQLLEICPE